MARRLAQARAGVLLSLALATSGCTWMGRQVFGAPPTGEPGHVAGFYGAVVADEPRAALTGRDVLSGGGNAADAAAAVGFTLAVTLPSRASLGSGGACLVYRPGRGGPVVVVFTPTAPAGGGAAERPAAVPMLALGLGTLNARYGQQPLANLLVPAQQLARFGVPVSRTLAHDIAVVGMPLLGDPAMREVFAPISGSPLGEGASMTQADLAATLAQLRDAGVEEMYRGSLARRLDDASRQAGAGLSLADLAKARASIAAPITVADGRDMVAFLPPPADGGLAAAAAFRVLLGEHMALGPAQARAIAVAARWRAGGVSAETLLAGDVPPASLPALPASTSFVTVDRHGMAVACALTMDNLFGTGRIAPGTGILLAASPAAVPPPLLAAAIAWNPHRPGFRAAIGGSGQAAAPVAVADGLIQALTPARPKAPPVPRPVPEPGRINVISCPGYLPGDEDRCRWMTDRRGTGAGYGGSED
jgi:gamma-glutamyltranspeptidase/glutathione hydrolase